MSLILPIVVVALVVGLFAPRVGVRERWLLAGWIMLVICYHYFRG